MSTRTESAASESPPQVVTPALLRDWPLPAAGESKYSRGQVVVIGGAARTPGAAMLAGLAALRVGAGRLTLAVADSVAAQVAVAVPESGVVPLDEVDEHVAGRSIEAAKADIKGADAVLAGPGLDDADEALDLLERLPSLLSARTVLLLDAFALGVAPRMPSLADSFGGRLVLTPNPEEAGILLDREIHNLEDDVREVARSFRAVVSCQGLIAHPDGRLWALGTGHGGLATSGSGDVLAGAIAGLCARGASIEQAAVWASHAHAAAGDRLTVTVGPVGFLARELLDELPRVIVEVGAG